jgi:hypothetical protein
VQVVLVSRPAAAGPARDAAIEVPFPRRSRIVWAWARTTGRGRDGKRGATRGCCAAWTARSPWACAAPEIGWPAAWAAPSAASARSRSRCSTRGGWRRACARCRRAIRSAPRPSRGGLRLRFARCGAGSRATRRRAGSTRTNRRASASSAATERGRARRSIPGTGACDLYEARPLSCRAYGPPVRIGPEDLPPCRLCFVGAARREITRCRVEIDGAGLEDRLLRRLLRAGAPAGAETVIAFALCDPWRGRAPGATPPDAAPPPSWRV